MGQKALSKRAVGPEATPQQGAGAPGALPGQDTGLSRDRRQEGGGRCIASFTGKVTTDALQG